MSPTVEPSLPIKAKANPPGNPALAGSGSKELAAPMNLLFSKSCTRRDTGTASPNLVSTTLLVMNSPARNFSPSLARTTPPSPAIYKVLFTTRIDRGRIPSSLDVTRSISNGMRGAEISHRATASPLMTPIKSPCHNARSVIEPPSPEGVVRSDRIIFLPRPSSTKSCEPKPTYHTPWFTNTQSCVPPTWCVSFSDLIRLSVRSSLI